MDTITQRQHHWLETLQAVSKQPLRISRNVNGKPSQWVSREEAEFPVDYRTVLHNEVVIDIDCTRWNEVKMFAEMVTETLDTQRIPYITAYTGGRGIHIHLFFFLSEDQKQQCEDMDVMPKDLRVWLLEYILTDCGITPKLVMSWVIHSVPSGCMLLQGTKPSGGDLWLILPCETAESFQNQDSYRLTLLFNWEIEIPFEDFLLAKSF